jgi:SAM-dependent methyltransferase
MSSAAMAAAFDAFSAGLREPGVAAQFASEARFSEREAELYIASIVNEAHLALRALGDVRLNGGRRVLEVGSGAGLLTAFLQSQGVDILGIEPVQDGFDVTPVLARIVRVTTGVCPNIVPIAASELGIATHGVFDVIFSINVVEHFQPLTENLAALARVMTADGIQIHTCPNYYVPYEPHFGIPLIPLVPGLTVRLWRRELRDNSLWRSLNFVTASDIRRYAFENGLEAVFETGAMGSALRRLRQEPAFAARHPRSLKWVADIAHHTGLLALLGRLPATLATPMTVLLRPKAPKAKKLASST